MGQNPFVSVVMITYNHELFVSKALESILMQKCDFEYELIIADDQSTDGTCFVIQQIIDKYSAADFVRFIQHKENKGIAKNFAWALQQARGEYIAICEGDDYWTDSLKLQKQVDFLVKNASYAMACNASSEVDSKGNEFKIANRTETTIDLATVLREGWFIRTASIVFKTEVLKNGFPEFYYSAYSTDYILQVMILKTGLCRYFPEVMSAYRRHDGGVSKANHPLQINRWVSKVKLLETLNNYTQKKYEFAVSLQQRKIKQHISFYLYRYLSLISDMGVKFYVKHGSLLLFFKEVNRRIIRRVSNK